MPSRQAPLERSLQTLFERHLEALVGVRFLASEYVTSHRGRMDTLGLDENGCPVVIEYKRERSDNVINQGLFYLDWLVDHRGDFELLARDRLGREAAQSIEWSAPRLICIAADFSKYDAHAVKQMGRNIALIRYRRFDNDLLLLEQITEVSNAGSETTTGTRQNEAPWMTTEGALPAPASLYASGEMEPRHYKTTISNAVTDADEVLSNRFADIETFLLGLGDDVTRKTLRYYLAFRRLKNFACVEVKPTLGIIRLYLKVSPDDIPLESGFTRDVRTIGHYGTGDLEVTLRDGHDLERAKPLILMAYEA